MSYFKTGSTTINQKMDLIISNKINIENILDRQFDKREASGSC